MRTLSRMVVRSTLIAFLAHGVLLGQGSGPRPPDLPILVQRAPLIVDATIQSIIPFADLGPLQDVVFSISTVMKGTPPPGNRVLLVHMAGGRGAGTIPMQTGERFILFLQPAAAGLVAQYPVREGLTRYGAVSRDNAVRINGGKLVVNPDMPFFNTHNGRSQDQFLRELKDLIGPQ